MWTSADRNEAAAAVVVVVCCNWDTLPAVVHLEAYSCPSWLKTAAGTPVHYLLQKKKGNSCCK